MIWTSQTILQRLALGFQRLAESSPTQRFLERQERHQDLDEEQPLAESAPEEESQEMVDNHPGKPSKPDGSETG